MTFEEILPKLIYTLISLAVIILARQIVVLIVKRFAKLKEKIERRTNLIIKYFDISFIFILIFWNILIWGVRFSDVGLVFSSVFAIIGVAIFAQWSIISNVTSGIILFFTFPFKIGDKIIIHDKEFLTEVLIIEDIKAFYTLFRTENNQLHSYPNNLILQKGISLVSESDIEAIEAPTEPSKTPN